MSAWSVPALGLALAALIIGGGDSGRHRLALLGRAPDARAGSTASALPPPAKSWRHRRRQRAALLDAAVTVPATLALELRSGRDVATALRATATELSGVGELSPRLGRAAELAAMGRDVGACLLGGTQGEPDSIGVSLRVTAACCSASADSGLPLADLLEAAAASARSGASLRGLARAELAGASSTAMVLCGLPVVGLAMGQLLGARPAEVLLHTAWGFACLVAGLGLTAAGFWWTRAIHSGLLRIMP